MFKTTIDFSAYIRDHTRDFTGREWVFKAINDWLAKPGESRFFLLTGEPGSGKTVIASRLCQFSQGEVPPPIGLIYLQKDFLSAIHFCSALDRRWINPQVFAESLALQLSARYPAYAKALAEKSGDRQIRIVVEQQIGTAEQVVGVIIKSIDLSGVLPEDAFIRVVREPLEELFREGIIKHVLILVDALDEALLYSGRVNIVSLLAKAEKLPVGVRFILTSRRDERVENENEFKSAKGVFLSASAFNKCNNEDIASYVERRLSQDKELALKLAELKSDQVTELVKTITKKAAGNFQYISYLLNAISKGQQLLSELEKLPAGLDALYYESLGRVIKLSNNDWSKDYSPLIGVLSVAHECMTQAQLQAFTGQSKSMIWVHLGHLQQFIEEVDLKERQIGEPGYRLYHQSFIDFFYRQSLMIENKRLRNSYYLPAEEWHKKIVEYYRTNAESWEKMDWKRVDDYGLRYLATHLYELRDVTVRDIKVYRQELCRLICKFFMLEKLVRFGSHQSLADDVKLAIEAAHSEENLVQEVRLSLIYGTLKSLATNVPPELPEAFAWVGQVDEALSYAKLIRNKSLQIQAYCLIGEALLDKKEKAERVFNQALEEIETMENESDKADTLLGIAVVLVKVKEDEWILPIAERICSIAKEIKDEQKPKALLGAVQTFANAGKFDRAQSVLEAIEDKYYKTAALSEISKAHIRFSDIPKATEKMKNALKMTWAIENEYEQADMLGRMVQVMAQLGDKNGVNCVSTVAEAIKSEDSKTMALCKVAQAFAEVQKFERAQVVIDEINNDYYKALALSGLAQALAQSDYMKASETANKALEVAESIGFECKTLDALSEMTQSLAHLWDRAKAVKIAIKVLEANKENKNEYMKTKTVGKVAQFFAQVGYKDGLDLTLSIAENIESPGNKALALSKIAQAMARFEDKEAALIAKRAFVVATGMDHRTVNWVSKALALNCVAYALAKSGERAKAVEIAIKAMEIAKTIECKSDKAQIVNEIWQTLAQLKGEAGTSEIVKIVMMMAETLKDLYSEGFIIAGEHLAKGMGPEFIQTLAQMEDNEVLNKALTTMEMIEGWYGKGPVERLIVQTLALMRDEEALNRSLAATMETIKDEYYKVYVLSEVAQALIQSGNRVRSIEIARKALDVANAIEDKHPKKAIALTKVAYTFAQSDDRKVELAIRAVGMAKTIKNNDAKAEALSHAAHALVQAGEKTLAIKIAHEALDVVETIKEENKQAPLRGIVQILAQLKGEEKALEIANRMLNLTETVWDEDFKIEMLSEIIKVHVLSEIACAFSQFSDRVKAKALNIAAHALAQSGESTRAVEIASKAVEIAKKIEIESDKKKALTGMAQILAQLKGEARAKAPQIANRILMVADTIKGRYSNFDKVEVLSEAVQALAVVKDKKGLNQALAGMEAIEYGWSKKYVLKSLAQALARLEERQIAAEKANIAVDIMKEEMIKSRYYQPSELSWAVQLFTRTGHQDQALSVWRDELDMSQSCNEVFYTLKDGALLIGEIYGGQRLLEIYKAMEEVDGWWV